MPMVHQVKCRSCLPLALYPWSRTVPRWNYSDGVSLAKSASASQRVTLADTTLKSQNCVKLRVNSPLKILPKKYYAQKLGYVFHARSKTLTTLQDLHQEKGKAYLPLLLCMTKFPGVESRNGNARIYQRILVFPMYRADSIYRKGKKGEGLIPSKVS